MSRDLKQLLHGTAAEPTRPIDPRGIVEQARRRTWTTRAFVSIVAVLAVAGAVLGAQQVIEVSEPPEIVDQPGRVPGPDGSVPSGWQTLRVGTAAFAVPGGWSVQRIDGTDDPMPCLELLASTEHRVYLADRLYTPSCPARTRGAGDEQGRVTVYAYPAAQLSPDDERALTGGGERVELSRAIAWMDDGEAYRTYLFEDLDAVLLVAHRWDPQIAGRILSTVRPVADPTVNGGLDCLSDGRFGGSPGLLPEGAEGATTAEQALREALEGYADRAPDASVVIVNDRRASVVVDGREVVTTRAIETDSGWFTSEITGCQDGWSDPPEGSQPPPRSDDDAPASAEPCVSDTDETPDDPSMVGVYFQCGTPPDPLKPRPRTVDPGSLDARLAQTVTHLAQGPTTDERERGYRTAFLRDPSLLTGVRFAQDTGTVTVSFAPDIRDLAGLGTATATGLFIRGLEATVFQFDEVDTLRLEIDGGCWTIDPYGTCTFTRD